MKTASEQGAASRAIGARFHVGSRGRRVVRGVVGFTTAVAAVALLAGCRAEMPAPVGLTAAPATPVTYNTAASFSVGIVPNRAPPVRIGDELGFTLSASTTGYGHLYLLNASGAVLALAENVPVAGGVQTVYPSPTSGFIFRATPPAGVERVVFLVTLQPFQGFGGRPTGPVQLPVKAHTFVTNLNVATGKLPRQGWAVTETRVEIVL